MSKGREKASSAPRGKNMEGEKCVPATKGIKIDQWRMEEWRSSRSLVR